MLDSAAAAAGRVFAAPVTVTVKNGSAVLTVKDNAGIARLFQPCTPRYRVKFNIIAGVYSGARLGAAARIFCAHAFNHLLPLKELIILAK